MGAEHHEHLQFHKTWVAVSDGAHARVFGYVEKNLPWRLYHQTARAVNEDESGSERERAEQAFAREVVQLLERGVNDNQMDRFVVVAPPRTLGAMRDVMREPLRKRLVTTVDKDYARYDEAALRQALLEILPLD